MTRMHWAFFAPELSATSSIVLGWIMTPFPSRLRRAGQHLADPPALVPRKGARLLDQHAVPDLARVGLVVGLEPLGPRDDALVARMAVHALDEDDARLRHLVAHDHSLASLLHVSSPLTPAVGSPGRAREGRSWRAPDRAWPGRPAPGSSRHSSRAATSG